MCYPIVAFMFLVIFGSGVFGTYWSIHANAMGDGFTTAGWIVAVGTLMVAVPITSHYPHCTCWRGRGRVEGRHSPEPEGVELEEL